MKSSVVALLLLATNPASQGDVPEGEVSLSGIRVGDSTALVVQKLGQPTRRTEQSDYLNLHYHYRYLTVSFSDGTVAGLSTSSRHSCTPKGLCVGDSIKRMRKLYGEPLISDRETGKFYEYYAVDLYCWLQIPATSDHITSIAVACQP